MKSRTGSGLWPTVAMVAVLAITFSGLVMGGPETDQAAESWPHGVDIPGGPKAYQRLYEIHDMAVMALPGASPTDKPNIERVLRASFKCVAYDGAVPPADPPATTPPAHAAPHTEAAAKVEAAWQALNMPPQPPEHPDPWKNWSLCADNLEHGHDE